MLLESYNPKECFGSEREVRAFLRTHPIDGVTRRGAVHERGRVSGGRVLINGQDLVAANPKQAADLRRSDMGSVFQDATGGLNPVRTIGWQIAEAVILLTGTSIPAR